MFIQSRVNRVLIVMGVVGNLCLSTHGQSFVPQADLPPLLEYADGRKVSNAKEFGGRRAEIVRLMCEYFIGTFPRKTPNLEKADILSKHIKKDGSQRRRVRLTWNTPNRRSFEIDVWILELPLHRLKAVDSTCD